MLPPCCYVEHVPRAIDGGADATSHAGASGDQVGRWHVIGCAMCVSRIACARERDKFCRRWAEAGVDVVALQELNSFVAGPFSYAAFRCVCVFVFEFDMRW